MSQPKPVIYQLVVRSFGNTNTTNAYAGTLEQNGSGKFADINEAAIKSLREFGITHIWLTGVLLQATLTDHSGLGFPPDDADTVKGRAGSFYAVRDYFDVCPDYAVEPRNRIAEFKALVQRIHAAGLKVLIDFVPNHVARNYNSLTRPDLNFGRDDDTTQFFTRDNAFFYLVDPPGRKTTIERPAEWNPEGIDFDGAVTVEDGSPGHPPKVTGDNGLDPHVDATRWYETIKLNYGFNFADGTAYYEPQPRTWGIMNEVIAYWQSLGVDGFRCDFAHFVPLEFWRFLLAESRQRDPAAYFVAEAYPWERSGDPITNMRQLTAAGFDAVYCDPAYKALKRIYVEGVGQEDYDAIARDTPADRHQLLQYLENHDERRVASRIDPGGDGNNSGFGSAAAGYQLAPLQYLQSRGPILVLNGQEVGEVGDGLKGYNRDDGRTSLFDYWCMPQHVCWVNGHRYDGGGLDDAQKALRRFYGGLLQLCQHPAIGSEEYWGLKYWNRPERFADCPDELYSYARYIAGAGELLLVVANFHPSEARSGHLRLPAELAKAAGLTATLPVRLKLDRRGLLDEEQSSLTRSALLDDGLLINIPGQSAHVYAIGAARQNR